MIITTTPPPGSRPIPPEFTERSAGCEIVVSYSTGKDSTACSLLLTEMGIPHRRVFFDTGWESAETYRYLREEIPAVLGPVTEIRWEIDLSGYPDVDVRAAGLPEFQDPETSLETLARWFEARLGVESSPMVRRTLRNGILPNHFSRWCTQELKVRPMLRWIRAQEDEILNVVGVRREESPRRARLDEWEWNEKQDGWVWRPLISWSYDDVIAIHRRHGVRPNPAYLNGADRVGCWPCIYSRKSEIRHLAEQDPERVAIIRDLELVSGEILRRKIAEKGGVDRFKGAGWFRARFGESGAWPIDRAVEWANTARGGRQVELFAAAPRDRGCVRWGMCDTGRGGEE